MNQIRILTILLISLLFLSSCKNSTVPKPRAFYRINFPEHQYKTYDSLCPFICDIPVYSRMVRDKTRFAGPCWLNLEYLPFNAKLQLTYKPIDNPDELYELAEETRAFVYKHTVKADGISEKLIRLKNGTSGMYYEISGNTASAIQFFLTDSSSNFIRGALYFNVKTNIDSLRPVINFLKADIDHSIATFEWK